ncbi:MAG: HD domain-containing protein [Treponema sp.]|nr:HD domain-containing protein [Treponema sp.]
MDGLIRVLAQALDMVEMTLTGASTNHGKRIAVLCAAMGRYLGLDQNQLSDLVSCALLHDNALTEYILLERENVSGSLPSGGGMDEKNLSEKLASHCKTGQRNADILPFRGNVDGFIRYHHERANGLGPFGLSEGYYPLGAELIAAADSLDVTYHLQRVPPEQLSVLRKTIASEIHQLYTGRAGEAMLAVLDGDMLASLRDDRIAETVCRAVPVWTMDTADPALIPIAELIARIIDYKSPFTRKHTQQIANRIWVMAGYYGYDHEQKIQLYLAASLHDIGKLAIPSDVLEKPGKLTGEEFNIIKSHIDHTRKLLQDAPGMELVTEWAANHHEKLDGSGYPLKKDASALDFNSRLMACIDIYQAVSEERPYHPRRSHAGTMPILNLMVERGGLDSAIVKDIDTVMEAWSERDVTGPEQAEQGA